jgi:streptogramin lyase
MLRRISRKRAFGAFAVLAVLAVASAALAYFTSTGSGTGSTSVGTASPWGVTSQPATGGPIYPGGGTANIVYTVTNNGSGDQQLSTITATVDADSNGDITHNGTGVAGCLASWFTTTVHQPTNPALPADLTPGQQVTGSVDLTMQDSHTNQDPCQGSTPDITINADLGGVIYATTNNGSAFAKIDPTTGAATVLGSSGYSEDWAAAIDSSGQLWTIINGFGTAQIAKVDKTTGKATPVGSPIGTQAITLEFGPDGTMYTIGYNNGVLYRIDKTTGVGTPIGAGTGIYTTMDLAFDCQGQLWATTMGDLYSVNTTTGTSTFKTAITGVAEGPSAVMGLMFDHSCHMLATTYTNPGSLYSINPATGAATKIGSTGLNYPHGGSVS